VGRSGIERAYQDVLGGTPGNLVVVVDAFGKQVSALDEEPPSLDGAAGHTRPCPPAEAAEAMAGQVGAVFALDRATAR